MQGTAFFIPYPVRGDPLWDKISQQSMPLSAGTRLGPYEILASIGAGGMGEVYRARDTKLDRDVAIKILTDSFAHDAERVARFEREAKVLAALNHPNIAQIYGLEERALIKELIEDSRRNKSLMAHYRLRKY
jgi:serine/threonine protein kinase